MKIGIGVTKPNMDGDWLGQSFIGNDFVYYRVGSTTIAKDKNILIKSLYDNECDYFFIFDDDTFPIKEGWEQFFIDASIKSGCQHFILGNDSHLNKIGGENGLTYFQKGTGCMLFLTRKVVEEVGYMNNKYGRYGYEHAAYSDRINRAALTPSWYVSVDGWEEYIYSWDLQKEDAERHGFVKVQQFTEQEKTKFISENEFNHRKERRSKKIYYDYEQIYPVKIKKVGYISLEDSGSSFYRIQGVLPFIDNPLIKIDDLTHKTWTSWSALVGYDILIFHRPFEAIHADVINQARNMGIWVIADYDDDVLNIPDIHASYDLYKENRANILLSIRQADEVWVSTPCIRETFYNFNHNIHIIPNAHNDYLMPVEYKKSFNPANKKVVYRGGNTHRLDLKHSSNELVKLAAENKDWEFTFIGVIDNQEFFDDNKDNTNVFLTSKTPIVQYLTYLQGLNAAIMICPLDEHKLNRGKSNISWIEGTYAGTAFFGNKLLPEFNISTILPLSLLSRSISENHIGTLKKCNEESWQYIKNHLLLSNINKIRIERLLA